MAVAWRPLYLPHDVLVASFTIAGLAQVVVLADLTAKPRAPDGLFVVAGVAKVAVVDVHALVLPLRQTHARHLRGLQARRRAGCLLKRLLQVGIVLAQLEVDHVR